MHLSKTKAISPSGAQMILVDCAQRSYEWFEWRKEGVTASDIPVILGLSPHKTAWQLWAEKTGRINSPDISKNPNVKRGVELEDTVRLLTEQKYGDILLPVCGECVDYRFLKASLDGMDTYHEVFEFKCPSDSVFDEVKTNGKSSPTFQMYAEQVYAQCTVSGHNQGHLIFYKEGEGLLVFDLELTTQKRMQIIRAAKQFWECVVNDVAPEIDPEKDCFIPSQGDESFKWQAEAERWCLLDTQIAELKEKVSKLEAQKKATQENLVTVMGSYQNADLSGVKVTRYERQGAIDYAKFLEDEFNEDFSDKLEAYRKSSSFQTRFTASKDELVNLEESGITLILGNGAYF